MLLEKILETKIHSHLGKEEYNSKKTTTEGTCEHKPLHLHVITDPRVRTPLREAKGCSIEINHTDMTIITSTMTEKEIIIGNKIGVVVTTTMIGTETMKDKATGTVVITIKQIPIKATTTTTNREVHQITDEAETSIRITNTHQTKTDRPDITKMLGRMASVFIITGMEPMPKNAIHHAE